MAADQPSQEFTLLLRRALPSTSRLWVVEPLRRHGLNSHQTVEGPVNDCKGLSVSSNERAIITDAVRGRIEAEIAAALQAGPFMLREQLLPGGPMVRRAGQRRTLEGSSNRFEVDWHPRTLPVP